MDPGEDVVQGGDLVPIESGTITDVNSEGSGSGASPVTGPWDAPVIPKLRASSSNRARCWAFKASGTLMSTRIRRSPRRFRFR